MTHTNRKFVLAYFLLVALPVLGLVGVLRTGHKLVAPISIGGQWKLQTEPVKLAPSPCGKSFLTDEDGSFLISQFGSNFSLSFLNSPVASGSGKLEGTTVKASVLPLTGSTRVPACGNQRVLSITATVNPKSNPRSIVGVLGTNDCPTCAPLEFRAFRVEHAKSNGGL